MKKFLRLFAVGLLVIGVDTIAIDSAKPQAGIHNSAVPELYFYAAPYNLANNSLLPTHLTVATEQITKLFPAVHEMTGVVLKISWSQLCPTADHCNFSVIDQTLSYWGARNKKVILNLSTMGPPVKTIINGQPGFVSETPEWVLRQVSTYPSHTATFGSISGMDIDHGVSHIDTVYPSINDPRFVSYVELIVRALGQRYDGNPTISYVRISTGKLGEDNPIPANDAGYAADLQTPGFSVPGWIQYCEQITRIYQTAFRRSQLEFDISFLPVAYVKNDPSERAAIDNFIKQLEDNNIFLAYNGLNSTDVELLETSTSGPGQALRYLLQAKRRGKRVGLEEQTPMFNPKMQDFPAVAKAMRAVAADRLVLFGLDAGAVNYVREGANPSNATTVQFMSKQNQTIEQIGQLDQQLLQILGY